MMKKRLEEAEKENLKLQKAKEELEEKNLELQKVIEERDKFFSIIAHDLKGPLGTFVGLAEMLKNDDAEITDEEEKDIKKALHTSAVNTYSLLEDLLKWSRMQQNNISFLPEQISLVNRVKKTIDYFEETAKNKGIKIVSQISWNIFVMADTDMIKTVIRNLLSNAIKFTNENGQIVISAKELDENFVQISISDTGIGMNPSMVNDLFRLDINTGRTGTKGETSTGFGLILCKEFVEKHGGKLWVESEEEKGSTFHFTLPIK